MNLLDRHIAKRYTLNILALLTVLACFVVAVDVFVNLQDYVRAAERLAGETESHAEPSRGRVASLTVLAVVHLWGPRLLQLYNYMLGIVLVGAMGFTCANFVRRREFIAMLASGRSLRRLAWPIFLIAGIASGIALANQEFILPRVAHLLPRGIGEAGMTSIKAIRVPLVRDGSSRLLYAARFDAPTQSMERIHIWERDETGMTIRRITARSAVWDGAGWALEGGEAERAAAPGRLEPVDRIDTDVDPVAILTSQIQGYGYALSWRQISDAIARAPNIDPAARERMDRIRYGRASVMASNILALIIALPFFLVREPKNMVLQSLKCAPLALAALIGAVIGSAAPLPGLPTWLGVSAPTFILLPIAIWAATSIKT